MHFVSSAEPSTAAKADVMAITATKSTTKICYKIIDDHSVANAIVCGGMGRECNLVLDFRQTNLVPTTNIKGEINKEGIRKMTPREWARLQGYPDDFRIVVADASAYKQFGNSVAVPAIQATAEQLLNTLRNYGIIRQ